MGASFTVHAKSADEFRALQSEGAPELHCTYSNSTKLLSMFGLEFDADNYCGTVDPHHIVDQRAEALDNAWRIDNDPLNASQSHMEYRVKLLIELAEVAIRLNRQISYA